MPQKLNIITSTDNTGLGWILEVLGISTLLIDKSKKTKINIDLLDGSPFLFKFKIYSILRKFFLSLPYIFKTTFFILKFFFNEKKVSRLQKNLEFNSIENRLIANEIVNLEFFNCEVEIKRISLNLSTMSYFFIFLKSVFFWVKIYFSKKKYNSFLNYR